MTRTLMLFASACLTLALMSSVAWAGLNEKAAIGLTPIPADEGILAYRVLVSGAVAPGVVHLEFSYDTSALEFVAWQDADFLEPLENCLRIGPLLDDPPGTVVVAIASKQFRSLTSFDVGVVSFRRLLSGNAAPTLARASLVDANHRQDWVVDADGGGGEAPPSPILDENVPVRFALRRVSPNPVIRNTTVNFEIPRPGAHVRIKVYEVTGRLARTLVNEYRTPGYYSEEWNLANDNGQRVAPGIYFCRMEAGEFQDTKKLVLLR